ncbi:MAG TPA: DNA recombination protein RmuC, partial [Candidatus Saccharibacteria bacterium]|nr:DNA recombination protein RmuC [Candidatus Saccharibacteria bacterium]
MVAVVLAVILAGLAFTIFFLSQKISSLKNDTAAGLIKQDITNLSENIARLKDSLNLSVNERLDKNQAMMRDSIAKQFSQSAKIISEVTDRLAKLDETNRRVVDVADELKTVQNILQNPKQRGVLGEYLLQNVLENVLPPERFQLQYRFKDGETVDAIITLDKNKILPIDSKFSLENYNRLI